MKLRDLASGEFTKPFVAKIVGFMAAGGLDLSAKNVARYANVDVRDVEKALKDLQRKQPLEYYSNNNFSPQVNRIIAGLYLIPYLRKTMYPRMSDAIHAMAQEIGIDINQLQTIISNHIEQIHTVHPQFRFDVAFPEQHKWGSFTLPEKVDLVKDAIQHLSGGKLGSVSGQQIAKFLINTYKLTDEQHSLARRIDELLSNDNDDQPENIKKILSSLEKYRVVGKQPRGSIHMGDGIKVW